MLYGNRTIKDKEMFVIVLYVEPSLVSKMDKNFIYSSFLLEVKLTISTVIRKLVRTTHFRSLSMWRRNPFQTSVSWFESGLLTSTIACALDPQCTQSAITTCGIIRPCFSGNIVLASNLFDFSWLWVQVVTGVRSILQLTYRCHRLWCIQEFP